MTQHASAEALAAAEEARHARADNEAILPLADMVSERVRVQVEANHFLDLIEALMRSASPAA